MDALTGELLVTFEGHTSEGGVRWSPSGDRLLTWHNDGTLRIWDPVTGIGLLSRDFGNPLCAGEWSPDGERIAVAEVVLHPRSRAGSRFYDAALLRLAEPVSVAPVLLAPDGPQPKDGTPAVVTGWGDTNTDDRYPRSLHQAEVTVIDRGREATRGTVQVGEPLTFGPVGLVLQGYADAPDGTSVALLAVCDPGYRPVVAAGLLLLLGLTVSFNFPHCWVHARIDPDGTLRLAGRADRRACDFGREFTALAGEIRSQVAGEREDTD